MSELIWKILYLVIILPFIMFLEGSGMFADFLKRKKVYSHWDIWHTYIVVLVVVAIILFVKGYY